MIADRIRPGKQDFTGAELHIVGARPFSQAAGDAARPRMLHYGNATTIRVPTVWHCGGRLNRLQPVFASASAEDLAHNTRAYHLPGGLLTLRRCGRRTSSALLGFFTQPSTCCADRFGSGVGVTCGGRPACPAGGHCCPGCPRHSRSRPGAGCRPARVCRPRSGS